MPRTSISRPPALPVALPVSPCSGASDQIFASASASTPTAQTTVARTSAAATPTAVAPALVRSKPGLDTSGRGLRLRRRRRPLVLLDEALDGVVGLVVRDLLRRRLHQVGARPLECARDPVVQRELREPDGVDDDPGRVRRVPDLELELHVQG